MTTVQQPYEPVWKPGIKCLTSVVTLNNGFVVSAEMYLEGEGVTLEMSCDGQTMSHYNIENTAKARQIFVDFINANGGGQ